MSVMQRVLGWGGTLQIVVLLAVLLYRRHYRTSTLFTLYVGGVAVMSILLGISYTRQTWIANEIVTAALRFCVALELTYRIFGAFPSAAATARRVMLTLLVLTAAMAMSAEAREYPLFATFVVPRLATGTVWILTALAALVLWYRLPLPALPKAILIGLAPYLLVFTVMMNLLASVGWQYRAWVGYVNTLSYSALLAYWSWVAWRTAPDAAPSYPAAALTAGAPRTAS